MGEGSSRSMIDHIIDDDLMSDPTRRAKVEAGWLLAGGAAEDLPPSLDTLACSVSSPALGKPRTI